ncbi:MAG TPA: hypothetical protein PLY87_09015 [Planctomycetaceae bacterium]|nr:hypothetical protein [Planctomycetaceae bacterium]HQZ65203.1 hypothetical protein [Planctomycetaceae bacterium]
MPNWKRWPDARLNEKFAEIEHPDRIVYPDLDDGSPSFRMVRLIEYTVHLRELQ